jgi:thioesterase domain-containing protein
LLADPQLGALLGSTIPEGVTAAHISKNLRMTRDNLRAAMSYRAAGYAGAVELFEPEGSAGELRNRLAGELGKLALGGMRRHEVGGNHYSMLRAPLVEGMAKAVDAALESISRD